MKLLKRLPTISYLRVPGKNKVNVTLEKNYLDSEEEERESQRADVRTAVTSAFDYISFLVISPKSHLIGS